MTDIAIQAPPGLPGQWFAQAIRHHHAGQLANATALYRQVLTVAPAHPDTLYLAGLAEHQAGRNDMALRAIDAAIQQVPNLARYHEARGHALRALERFDDALTAFRQAIRIDPGMAVAHYNMGLVLQSLDRMDEAADAYRAALRLDATMMMAHNNLGLTLHNVGRFDEAEQSLRTALTMSPNTAEVMYNLGSLMTDIGRLDEARTWLEPALKLAPDHFLSRIGMMNLNLKCGQLRGNWLDQETRWQALGPAAPEGEWGWDGRSLDDGTLLVVHEQGFGDSLQFCRFASLAAQRARVVLSVPPQLVRLLSSLEGVAAVVSNEEPAPAYEHRTLMLSLPHPLAIGMEDLPGPIPYLHADAADIARWRDRVAPLPGRKVGLVWAGNPRLGFAAANRLDIRRSMHLAQFAPLGTVPGVSFVSLQKGAGEAEAANPPEGMALHDWTAELHDFAETAALICALDLVICVDTSVAHLAGALGRPVWMLNRFDSDWRWMTERSDSPWYPSMRMFRQPAPGDWTSVIAAVRTALEES